MSLSRRRKPTLVILSLLLALAILSAAPMQPAAPAASDNTIALKAPAFVQVANAQEAPDVAPMGFPQDEAGISAYFKSATPVTLVDVRSVFRVIEVEAPDYIIGSVPDIQQKLGNGLGDGIDCGGHSRASSSNSARFWPMTCRANSSPSIQVGSANSVPGASASR